MHEILPVQIKGHVHIEDDLGNVLLDKDNAIHPQNMARVISRALANESNYFVKYIAYGNGGTDINAALDITFNQANDGQTPDIRTWDSQLYNETYREIVDDSDINIGTGVGSASGDPTTVEHVSGPGVFSNELGILSQVTINAVLNRNEPTGQIASGTDADGANFDGSFVFDEIGLITDGKPLTATAGYQDVQVGLPSEVNSDTSTGLIAGREHDFQITVDGGTTQTISFTVPSTGGSGTGGASDFTYGDLCEAINTGDTSWGFAGSSPLPGGATILVTDTTGNYSTLVGAQTFGYLRIQSATSGASSSIDILNGTAAAVGSPQLSVPNDLFDGTFGLNPAPSTGSTIQTAVAGEDVGVQNDPVNSTEEAERLLAHVTFAPVLKAASRELTVTYTLTVAVARSTSTT
jgi:hypothetical protein